MDRFCLILFILIKLNGFVVGQTKSVSSRYENYRFDIELGLNFKSNQKMLIDLDRGMYTPSRHILSNFHPGIFIGFGLRPAFKFYAKPLIFSYDPIFRYDHVKFDKITQQPIKAFIIDQSFLIEIIGKSFNYGGGFLFMNTNQSIIYTTPDGFVHENDLKLNGYRFVISKKIKKLSIQAEFLYHHFGMLFFKLRKSYWSANTTLSYRIFMDEY